MSYNAQAIKVMIASPSDVLKERELIRAVIHEWNAVHAEDRKVVLMPIGWETHSRPASGDRPQAIITRQLKTCDVLVAVFWARLGSPTGAADSGTVEEINEHVAAGKPAMIYFSSAPVHPGSVDAEQYAKLLAFKQSIRSRALFHEYEELGSFRTDFTVHLAQTVIEHFTGMGAADATDRPPPVDRTPALSEAAHSLLLEAVQDSDGAIMLLETMDGTHVGTNKRNFVEGGSGRVAAQWRGAVHELYRLGLVEDRTGREELFFVTDAGYRAAGGPA